MEHIPATDIAALEAEIAALEAEDAALEARVSALLATGSAAVRLADCQVMAKQAAHDLAVQERYQRRIARAIDAH
jgi:cell division protein FtsB